MEGSEIIVIVNFIIAPGLKVKKKLQGFSSANHQEVVSEK
jgi:hypothetical protein